VASSPFPLSSLSLERQVLVVVIAVGGEEVKFHVDNRDNSNVVVAIVSNILHGTYDYRMEKMIHDSYWDH